MAFPEGVQSGERVAESFWRSLRFFSLYRLVVAAVFMVGSLLTGGSANLGSQNPWLFLWIDGLYLALSIAILFVLHRFRRAFDAQLSVQVSIDVLALMLLMYASGGAKSGIAFMLVVVVAGAGLVGQGRLTLFYAALATLAVLIEQVARMLKFGAEGEDFVRTGLTSIGFFATAVISQLLARRVVANENLARQRGAELADQVRINRQVIEDMEDGVLVVNAAGEVCLHNPRAAALLMTDRLAGTGLADYSSALAEHLRRRPSNAESTDILRLPSSGRSLLVRLLPSEEGGNTLIYLQDMDRAQAQAQQIKLAALGRLTANIAHEIRNPLAAISHAAELLADEQWAEARSRLTRIIGDNSGRLNRLVTEVLDLGRSDHARQEPVDLAGFLRSFVEEYTVFNASAGERIRISVEEGAVICFDRAHLHRVMENLVTNALYYASSATGAVTIAVSSLGSGRVELHVVDDGPGIAPADRVKVFEPFFTTRGGGTGLGLYIARELCDANGARLELVDGQTGGHFRIFAKGGECQANSTIGAGRA